MTACTKCCSSLSRPTEMPLGRDPAKSAALEQLNGDADEALETLRDLARGEPVEIVVVPREESLAHPSVPLCSLSQDQRAAR
jgi:hypothetical protein